MRLFLAVWPSPQVCARIEGLPRPAEPSVRWTTPDQWHVTLRFLGEIPDERAASVEKALHATVGDRRRRRAGLGPATIRLGRSSLVAPVTGLDDLGRSALAETLEVGKQVVGPQRFFGHLTLARGRGRRPVPDDLAGQPLTGAWEVTAVTLVRSYPGGTGSRYEVVASAPLG